MLYTYIHIHIVYMYICTAPNPARAPRVPPTRCTPRGPRCPYGLSPY